jgi:hypothetical protein
MTDQLYGAYEFEIYFDSVEGRTLNYPVYFATWVYSHRRAQARYRGVAVTLDTWIHGWRSLVRSTLNVSARWIGSVRDRPESEPTPPKDSRTDGVPTCGTR